MDESTRQLVRERAAHRCEYCRLAQTALPWARFHVEHIRARQHGGSDDVDNLALACRRCNWHKGPNLTAIDPESGNLATIYNPRLEDWSEHFKIVEYLIIGLTATGRATAALLAMNHPDRVHVRRECV